MRYQAWCVCSKMRVTLPINKLIKVPQKTWVNFLLNSKTPIFRIISSKMRDISSHLAWNCYKMNNYQRINEKELRNWGLSIYHLIGKKLSGKIMGSQKNCGLYAFFSYIIQFWEHGAVLLKWGCEVLAKGKCLLANLSHQQPSHVDPRYFQWDKPQWHNYYYQHFCQRRIVILRAGSPSPFS